MAEVLLLRIDAPLVSFGAAAVDHWGVIREFPAQSMLTGMIGNALGFQHAQADELQRLQDRLHYAVRRDRLGTKLQDYQTVDLGQEFMLADKVGWTTRGVRDKRKGGTSSKGTHIRYRNYWADSVFTVGIGLDPADVSPTLDDIEKALIEPARPLFVGRKCCIPATPLVQGRANAASVLDALISWPAIDANRQSQPVAQGLSAWWSNRDASKVETENRRELDITDKRDWRNQIHVGQRTVVHGLIHLTEASDD